MKARPAQPAPIPPAILWQRAADLMRAAYEAQSTVTGCLRRAADLASLAASPIVRDAKGVIDLDNLSATTKRAEEEQRPAYALGEQSAALGEKITDLYLEYEKEGSTPLCL